jgi:hypothetical protein
MTLDESLYIDLISASPMPSFVISSDVTIFKAVVKFSEKFL